MEREQQLEFTEKLVPRLRPNATREEKFAWLALVARLEEIDPAAERARVIAITRSRQCGNE